MELVERPWDEVLKRRYVRFSKFILIIAVIYTIWTSIVIASVYLLRAPFNWAGFPVDIWVMSNIGLLAVLLGIECVFLLHFLIERQKHMQPRKPKKTFFHGKRLFTYTIPESSHGGFFTKTYIEIDDESILNLRYQMIPSQDLWKKNIEKIE